MSKNIREGFRFLDHTGDAKFQAYGRSLEEAFIQSAYALLSLMWERKDIRRTENVEVACEGRDLPQLLVSFLEEILFLLDARFFVLSEIRGLKITDMGKKGWSLGAIFSGQPGRESIPMFGEVKAVTYNEMTVEKDEEGVLIQVVVDL